MDKIVGLITANFSINELNIIAGDRTIASLPYGSRYRIIDFPLSNMVNSGIMTVGIITPYKYRSIIDHVGAGSEWSLDRKEEGLFILPGSVYGVNNSCERFMIRDFARNKIFFERSPAPYVIVAATNTVCNMDYSKLYEAHKESGADITMAYTTAHQDDKMVNCIHEDNGKVTNVTVGVKEGDKAFIDCFIINTSLLMDIVEWYAAVNFKDLFQIIEYDSGINVQTYKFDGYVSNIFNIETYFKSCMDPLNFSVHNELFTTDTPILTKEHDSIPSKYGDSCDVRNSLIPAGCKVSGTVEDSVLFRNVVIEPGAVVKNSIIMQNCVIKSGAVIENAIIDMKNTIQSGIVIKGTTDNIFIKEKNN